MAVSRLCPLALAFAVASVIAISTVYTFINGYNDEDFSFRLKRNLQIIKRNVDKEAKLAHERFGIRLPDHVRPLSYDIVIQPNLTTFKFLGDVKIELQCHTSTRNIIFHVRDLHLRNITLTDSKHNLLNITSRTFHSKYQQYVIRTSEELEQRGTYILQVMYHGALSNNTIGFYKSSYRTNNGEKRYLAATQFEATSARSAFPCFDEPSFKAVFRITVRHDKNRTALSNMPLQSRDIAHDGLTESRFLESLPMSTYLVAFIVCDFEYKETNTKNGKKIRVWSRPDAINNTAFALDVAKHTMEYYDNYFDVPYPLPKMDLIAIPDMGGAMENWGLVTFSEPALLYDPTMGSAADQKLVAMIVDHELAHQWFGNLVTMEWWSDLWLNEGFAVFMEYLATDAYDAKWKREDQFMLDTLKNALDADSSVHTHPVSVKVQKPAQINEIVDQITYHKGSSVIRMLQSFLDKETFRKGIKLYLKEHQFSNAKASDLWKALSKVSAIDVTTIMDSWVTKKGFPVITLTSGLTQRKDGGLSCTASQKRFLRDYSALPLADNEQSAWYVPLTFITEDSPGSIKTIWMNSTSVAFQLGASRVGWVKANVGQTGFYRVNYDEENWRQLIRQLLQNHTVLSPSDRSGLVDDALSLARAGLLDYKTALDMTEYLSWETEYIPWAVALRSLAYVGNMIRATNSYRLYQRYIIKKIKPLEQKLGWQDVGGMIDKFLRDLTLSTLCANGDAEAVNRTKSLFEDWKKNNGSHSGPAYLRKLVFHTAVQHGGDKEWKFLWMKYMNNGDAAEREKIIFALSGSQRKDLLNRLLSFSLDKNKVRAQDAVQIITTVAGNTEGRNLAWKFYKRNFYKLVKRFGRESRAIVYLLERTTENMNTLQALLEVKQLVEKHRNMSLLRSTKKIQETIQSNIHWVSMYTRTVEDWFKNKAEKG